MFPNVFSSMWWILISMMRYSLNPVAITSMAAMFGFIYYLLTKHYDYWPLKGVPGPRAKFPWGTNFGFSSMTCIRKFIDWLYFEQGGKKYCGYIEFHKPTLFVGDLDLIRCITIKDFEHFTDRRVLDMGKEFRKMLINLNGQEWKETRSTMTPTFSARKIHNMHQLCLNNAESLSKYVREEMQTKDEIELKDAFGRFTMDNIASCAFGVDCNSFTDPNTEFAKNAGRLFEPPSGLQIFRFLAVITFGHWALELLPDPLAPAAKFFTQVVRKTQESRKSISEKRKDFLQLLTDTTGKDGKRKLTDESIIAQSILFFIVGYDTTAALLAFAAYCMATEPEWQRRVHQEIDQVLVRHDGQLTYEAVGEMTQLDNVLSETLRLYPPAIFMERQCTKDYRLPGTNVTIEKGTIVRMPIYSLHRDPDLHPEPLKFNPDRFLPQAREDRHPCAYIPFGSGPRNCIAMRFALFEAKVALVAVLKSNTFEPGPRTPVPPMPLADDSFLLKPKTGCGYIRVVSRE